MWGRRRRLRSRYDLVSQSLERAVRALRRCRGQRALFIMDEQQLQALEVIVQQTPRWAKNAERNT